MLTWFLLADAVDKGGPGSGPRLSGKHRDAIERYRENPGDNTARSVMTSIAGKTTTGKDYEHLHPGEQTVYRAGSAGNRGQSWTKSLNEARRHLEIGKEKVLSLKLTRNDPALDVNRANPGSRYSNEREVYVDMRNIDHSRISKV